MMIDYFILGYLVSSIIDSIIELIIYLSDRRKMEKQYKWDYTIKIKTKEGTFEYEKENLNNIDLLLEKHPDYEEVQAIQNKPKVKVLKRNEIRKNI